MHESLHSVVKTYQCAQYQDDIGIVANNATDIIRSFRAVYMCIRRKALKLTIEICHFGIRQVKFLRRTILLEGSSPQA